MFIFYYIIYSQNTYNKNGNSYCSVTKAIIVPIAVRIYLCSMNNMKQFFKGLNPVLFENIWSKLGQEFIRCVLFKNCGLYS